MAKFFHFFEKKHEKSLDFRNFYDFCQNKNENFVLEF